MKRVVHFKVYDWRGTSVALCRPYSHPIGHAGHRLLPVPQHLLTEKTADVTCKSCKNLRTFADAAFWPPVHLISKSFRLIPALTKDKRRLTVTSKPLNEEEVQVFTDLLASSCAFYLHPPPENKPKQKLVDQHEVNPLTCHVCGRSLHHQQPINFTF